MLFIFVRLLLLRNFTLRLFVFPSIRERLRRSRASGTGPVLFRSRGKQRGKIELKRSLNLLPSFNIVCCCSLHPTSTKLLFIISRLEEYDGGGSIAILHNNKQVEPCFGEIKRYGFIEHRTILMQSIECNSPATYISYKFLL